VNPDVGVYVTIKEMQKTLIPLCIGPLFLHLVFQGERLALLPPLSVTPLAFGIQLFYIFTFLRVWACTNRRHNGGDRGIARKYGNHLAATQKLQNTASTSAVGHHHAER